jgi:hypothetical protein|tara:strand:- start:90 stop:758 length:669 start_codon:yes stop_codon:yes gene_type:complete
MNSQQQKDIITVQKIIRGNITRKNTKQLMSQITEDKVEKRCRENDARYIKMQSIAPYRSRQNLLHYDNNRNLLRTLQRAFSNKNTFLTIHNMKTHLPKLLNKIFKNDSFIYTIKINNRNDKYELMKNIVSIVKDYLPFITVKTKSYRYFSRSNNCCFEMNHDEIKQFVKEFNNYFYQLVVNKLLKHNDSDVEYIYNLISGYDKDEAQLQKTLRSICKIVVLR